MMLIHEADLRDSHNASALVPPTSGVRNRVGRPSQPLRVSSLPVCPAEVGEAEDVGAGGGGHDPGSEISGINTMFTIYSRDKLLSCTIE